MAPTRAPTIFLGNRIFQITISSVVWTFPKSVCTIVEKEISTEPRVRLATIANIVNPVKKRIIIIYVYAYMRKEKL